MKVLVTGAAGFIGYHICKNLLSQGHSVIGIDNFSAEYDISINKWRFQELQKFENFKFIYMDVSKDDAKEIIEEKTVDYVIQGASKDLYYNEKDPKDYTTFLTSNVLATSRMFELARVLRAKKFILLSTYIIYGNTRKETLTEKYILPKPRNTYAASRLAEEQAVEFMSTFYKLPSVVLRIFSAYGPASRPGTKIPVLINNLSKNKTVTLNPNSMDFKDYIYVEDVVRCIRKAMTQRLKFQTINIASGITTDDIELAKKLSMIMGKESLIEVSPEKGKTKNEKKKIVAGISRAEKILKFNNPIMLEDGLTNTYNWYKNNPEFFKGNEKILSS